MTERESPQSTASGRFRRIARGLLRVLFATAAILAVLWATVALAIDGPGVVLAIAYALASIAVFVFVRPRRRSWIAIGALFVLVLGWWFSIAPSNDRDWQPDVSRLTTMQVNGDHLTVNNVRNFVYRSEQDFTPRWEERSYDLSRIVGVDLLVCDWGAPMIVHTMLSFDFADGDPLAISIETRKERNESYSALRGFFRQFELYYAVGDERDLIGVRTVTRGEHVRLHRLSLPRDQARALLLDYARQVNRLAEKPVWYNALDQNCTTTIRLHAIELGIEKPWNWRILINGYGEELLYMRGMVNTSIPFDELRARADVTETSRAAYGQADFSQRIRASVPPRPGGP
jgi:hypothetical protein